MAFKSRTAIVSAVVLLALLVVFAVWRLSVPATVSVVEYRMLQPNDIPTAVAAAPDGTVWFTIDLAAAIGRVQAGKLERLPKPKGSVEPIGIAVTADGAAWYPDAPARQIQRMAPSGELTFYTLETPLAQLGKIAAAPDGAVWFVESSMYSVTRLKDGKWERHVIDSIRARPYGVAVASDGTVWVTLQAGNQLLRIATDGQMSTFDVPTRGSSATDIAVDAAGGVWFIEFRSNKLGHFFDGRFEEISLGEDSVGLTGIAVAPDGAVWFAMLRQGSLARFKEGKIKRYRLPRADARPYDVAADKDGNIWYTDLGGYVGMLPADQARAH